VFVEEIAVFQGGSNMLMPEDLLDGPHVHPGHDQVGGGDVPEVMYPGRLYAGFFSGPPEKGPVMAVVIDRLVRSAVNESSIFADFHLQLEVCKFR
jgi:hypothetical protein